MFWQHTKLYNRWIKGEEYEIHRYMVPNSLSKRIKFLQKYFRAMDKGIPQQHKRRKSPLEYAEVAVMILGRIDTLFQIDVPIVAGSAYLTKIPWAIFGNCNQIETTKSFRNFDDIADNYKELITTGAVNSAYFHFRVATNLPIHLAEKHHATPHFIVAIGLCLLYDIIMNCGPDCEELYDLFNNDRRKNELNVDKWHDIRCKAIGTRGRIRKNPHNYSPGQIYEPTISLTTDTKIEQVSELDDLSLGEKVWTKPIQSYSWFEEEDDVYDEVMANAYATSARIPPNIL